MARRPVRSNEVAGGSGCDSRPMGAGSVVFGWPPVLNLHDTLIYVGRLAPATWLGLVAAKLAPQPVQITPGRVGWRTRDLDDWLEDRAAQGQDQQRPNTWDDFEP